MPRIHTPSASRGFTMIELLIVVGIIGVLIGLSLFIGSQVMGGSKARATEDTLRILDAALQDYIAATGGNPPAIYEVPGGNNVIPIADARDMNNSGPAPAYKGALAGNQMINSVGYFFAEASKVPSTRAILEKIPSKYLRTYDPDSNAANSQPPVMTVFDGWDRPIRFVHPTWQGVMSGDIAAPSAGYDQPRPAAQVLPLTPPKTYLITSIRRNNRINPAGAAAAQDQPDADGGMCVGYRPYFYSLGPDGLAGVRMTNPPTVLENYNTDNVYAGPSPNFTDK